MNSECCEKRGEKCKKKVLLHCHRRERDKEAARLCPLLPSPASWKFVIMRYQLAQPAKMSPQPMLVPAGMREETLDTRISWFLSSSTFPVLFIPERAVPSLFQFPLPKFHLRLSILRFARADRSFSRLLPRVPTGNLSPPLPSPSLTSHLTRDRRIHHPADHRSSPSKNDM